MARTLGGFICPKKVTKRAPNTKDPRMPMKVCLGNRYATLKKEEEVANEVIVEEEPVLTVEDEIKPISPTELVESLTELKDRAKAAGIRPAQAMLSSYISQGLAVVDGLLESLEGPKKKKDE